MTSSTGQGRESKALVEQLAAGHRDFLAFLERRVGSRTIAEDLLQEGFARGLEHLDDLRKEDSAVAWVYRVLRNAVIDHHRRGGSARRGLEAFARELESRSAPAPDVRAELCRCIGGLAGTLRAEYADAIRRIEVEGVAIKDTASEVGISAGNAGVRIFRARKALRAQVARSCGTCAEHGCLDCDCRLMRRGM